MAIVKCEKGHYYDDVKYKKCPHCETGLKHIKKELHVDDLNEMMTLYIADGKTDARISSHMTVNIEDNVQEKDEMTVGIYSFSNGTKPLAGWLVCIAGPAKGRDYRLFYGWNKIGRKSSMDVYISEDEKISRDNHAAIIFDEKTGMFHLVNGQGALTYLNGEHVMNSNLLEDGDKISMGNSDFIFIVFCKGDRKWEKE